MAYESSTTYLLTYLLDYRRNSVIVSQTKNDHMQAYMILMEGKENFFIWNGLIVDRLTGPSWWWICEMSEVGASVHTFL